MRSLDHSLFLALNRGVANSILDWVMPRITNLHKDPWFAVPVIIFVLCVLFRGRKLSKAWVICAVLAVSIADPLSVRVAKKFFNRDRPCKLSTIHPGYVLPETRMVPGETCPGSASFPSSHASNMMALATICWWFHRKSNSAIKISEETEPIGPTDWKPYLWFLLPLIIGYSRIYLGYHYPSDVIGGWICGSLISAVIIAIYRGFIKDDANSQIIDVQNGQDEG